jgi:hypothetical protein
MHDRAAVDIARLLAAALARFGPAPSARHAPVLTLC